MLLFLIIVATGIFLKKIGEEEAEKKIRVAIIDTGIAEKKFQKISTQGFNVLEANSPTTDKNGHGTKVASVLQRLSQDVVIMPIKAIPKSGFTKQNKIAQGIIWAVNNQAKIINISAGVSQSGSVLKEAVDFAYDNDVIIVAAAGREGREQVDYPAAFEKVLGVGAVDENCQRLAQANFGVGLDLVVLAKDIEVLGLQNKKSFVSGTSVAVPIVVAEIAKIMLANPQINNLAEVRNFLKNKVYDLNADGWDKETGYGVLNQTCSSQSD